MKVWSKALLGLVLGAAGTAQAAPRLETPFGPVVGTEGGGIDSFLGIPFAAPPVGSDRWRPPRDPSPWTALRPATAFGPECVQMGTVTDPATGEAVSQAVGSEDCLYLNLWRPSAPSADPRPILVWIHGGANTAGAASIPLYDGAKLAATQDAVVVSIQYRLNMAGFFRYAPVMAPGAVAASGDFGLLDQMQALRFVQGVAAAAGGDPDRVMIFGESAGGYNVWSLLMSDRAEGLFGRAAIESGCPDWVSAGDAALQAQRIAETLVVAGGLTTEEDAADFLVSQGDAWISAYLRAKPMGEMLEALSDQLLFTFNFGAIADGAVLPLDPTQRLIDGDYPQVPTIIGDNRDESKALYNALYPIGAPGYRYLTGLLFGDYVDEVEAVYPRRDYRGDDFFYERLVDMSDGAFEVVCTTWAAVTAAAHHPVWLYRFDYDDLAPPADAAMGAGHTYELYFVFGNQDDAMYAEGSAADRRDLTADMQSAWGCLAREGRPDACPASPPWPQLNPAAPRRIHFDAPGGVQPIPASEFEKMEFWLDYPPERRRQLIRQHGG